MTRSAILFTFVISMLVFQPASADNPNSCFDFEFVEQDPKWTCCGERCVNHFGRFNNNCNRSVEVYVRSNHIEHERAEFCRRDQYYEAIAPGQEGFWEVLAWPGTDAKISWCVEWADEPGRCAPDRPACPAKMTEWYSPAPCAVP